LSLQHATPCSIAAARAAVASVLRRDRGRIGRVILQRTRQRTGEPVRIVSAMTPGGLSDVLARIVAQHLEGKLNGKFFVENRPGDGPLSCDQDFDRHDFLAFCRPAVDFGFSGKRTPDTVF
jgi:hypothetical protein